MSSAESIFHNIVPGEKLPGDWFAGILPVNMEIGENSVVDSSFCFKHFFSTLPVGFRTGNNVTLWRTAISTEAHGIIEIGDDSYLSNASLVCSERISIGKRVMIAGGVTIADSDFHPIGAAERIMDTIALSPIGNAKSRPPAAAKPVFIEDDVWIGFNATILKGVHVGAGAVINPGAVVIDHVMAGTTVAGNPAKPINTPA